MLGSTAAGAIVSFEVLATGVCLEHPAREIDRTRQVAITGSFIVSAYVWHAHRSVSHTPWDTCE
jgi:hypothetical protein